MIYGLDADGLPENHIPLEAVSVIKCLDEEGDQVIFIRATDGLTAWEELGMLEIAKHTVEVELHEGFLSDDDEL